MCHLHASQLVSLFKLNQSDENIAICTLCRQAPRPIMLKFTFSAIITTSTTHTFMLSCYLPCKSVVISTGSISYCLHQPPPG